MVKPKTLKKIKIRVCDVDFYGLIYGHCCSVIETSPLDIGLNPFDFSRLGLGQGRGSAVVSYSYFLKPNECRSQLKDAALSTEPVIGDVWILVWMVVKILYVFVFNLQAIPH